MKKIFSFFLALFMICSMTAMCCADVALANTSNLNITPYNSNDCTFKFVKVGEDSEYVYFEAIQPCYITSTNCNTLAVHPVPAYAQYQTAVNKTKGKILVTVTIMAHGIVTTASCDEISVYGDMGNGRHPHLSATNNIPKTTIYINTEFTGLKKNVETGIQKVFVSSGTFKGPNNLTGYFRATKIGEIDLSTC